MGGEEEDIYNDIEEAGVTILHRLHFEGPELTWAIRGQADQHRTMISLGPGEVGDTRFRVLGDPRGVSKTPVKSFKD